MIMYLNEDWQKADGGELCIYQADRRQNIAPENGSESPKRAKNFP